MTLFTVLSLILCIGLAAYLFVVLLKPELFP